MSHITLVAIKITDLKALKLAAQDLGAKYVEGQTTYKWYGQRDGSDPLPEGLTLDMLGKCQHAIKVDGVNYEVGVVKLKDGSYTLAWDEYSYQEHDGEKLIAKFGKGLKKLTQMYGVAKTKLWARANGRQVRQETLANGTIKLTLAGA